jgi:DNA-binding GntR family transcriptional regulator
VGTKRHGNTPAPSQLTREGAPSDEEALYVKIADDYVRDRLPERFSAADMAKRYVDSYRFRMTVEPAALLEPGFLLDRKWAARCRREHDAVLGMRSNQVSTLKFFDINADFHATLAACTGNHFFRHAIQFQKQLRRFVSYNWTCRVEHIAASCEEHLAILTALESDERDLAASLMCLHLTRAATLKPVTGAGAAGTLTPAHGARPTQLRGNNG